jgi:hypothetical protein
MSGREVETTVQRGIIDKLKERFNEERGGHFRLSVVRSIEGKDGQEVRGLGSPPAEGVEMVCGYHLASKENGE